MAGADNRHRTLGIEVEVAFDIEQHGTILRLLSVEPLGKCLIGIKKHTYFVTLTEPNFLFGPRECRAAKDSFGDSVVASESGLDFRRRQREDVLVGIELQQLAAAGGAETRRHGESYLAEEFHFIKK